MADEGFKRKLTAILSADVEGYSRLMGDDEEATVRTLTSYREVLTTLIQQHSGIVLDSPGDNLLAEFVSVVDAVQCAVAVQKEIHTRNEALPENRRMQFRIGINLGDVIQEKGRIYGDGVNIAARLESLADPGGICISKTAFDHIESKLPYGYDFIGEQTVKNIAKPVGAYRVQLDPRVTVSGKPVDKNPPVMRRTPILVAAGVALVLVFAFGVWQFYVRGPSIEPASVEKMAFPLPDKPSIAVLPFDNLSKDQSDAYIADGLSENIISSLSKIPDMLVIARNSTFVYKGKAVKINQVAEELGVRYVLEGSVQKSEDKIRVIAQLIDAVSGHHLWSERYDREIKDFFKILDEITIKIADALRAKMVWSGDVHGVPTNSFEAWSYKIKGGSYFDRFTKQDNIKTRELSKKALKLDPEYGAAWTLLAWTHFSDARNGFTDTPLESIKQAQLAAQKASAINDRDASLQNLWASLYLIQRQHEKAIAAGQKAIELNPNFADGYALLAQIMYYSGRPDEAITLSKQAMRLAPYTPAYYLVFLGWGYQGAGRYQEALSVFQKLLDRAQAGEFSLLFAHINMTTSYSLMGDYEKAREHWAEVLKIYPNASLKWISRFHFFKDPDQLERVLDVYRAVGIE
jgi:adenylate cyclase